MNQSSEKDGLGRGVPDTHDIKDTHLEAFIIKKTEKLTSALYRLTEALHENEPLKWDVRSLGLLLLTDTITFIASSGAGDALLQKLIVHISKLRSFLEAGFIGGVFSPMNFSILHDEYGYLKDILIRYKNSRTLGLSLNLFDTDLVRAQDNVPRSESEIILKDISKRQIEGTSFQENAGKPQIPMFFKGQLKKEPVSARSARKKESPTTSLSGLSPKTDVEKEKRRELILDYIRKHGEVSIKDVVHIEYLANNYSEKTIQRDLTELISDGILKKRGERRWSKYFV